MYVYYEMPDISSSLVLNPLESFNLKQARACLEYSPSLFLTFSIYLYTKTALVYMYIVKVYTNIYLLQINLKFEAYY